MRKEILEKIKKAGVVGAGGAGFPTHVKFAADSVEYIIVNGAECEPLIKVDQQLMDTMAENLVQGLEIVMQVTGASKGIFALKGKYTKAINSLENKIKGKPIELFILDDFYPAGDEQVTVLEVTGRVVPEGGIPLQVGCIVTNVETLINIYNAVEDIPVTDTFLTITGDVPNPITLRLPIGVSVKEVVALTGCTDLEDKVYIDGGPMMGKVATDFSKPITKTTKAIIVLPKEHPLIQRKTLSLSSILKQAKSVCIQCSRCTDLCPRYLTGHGLMPHKIMRSVSYLKTDAALKKAFLCSECAACELYACPMMLSPRAVNAWIKTELRKVGVKLDKSIETPTPRIRREFLKIPVKRLIGQLGLSHYDHPAKLTETDFTPKVVKIPLQQHIGKPCKPIVKIGQSVKKGDLIGVIPENALGANIHASIDGTVKEISDYVVIEENR